MESFLSRYRNPLVLLAIVLAQLLGLAVQVRRPNTGKDGEQTRLIRYWVVSAFSPFERAFLFVGHGVSSTWHNYLDLRHVRQQNQELQSELNRIRLEQSSLAVDAREGLRLQKLFGFQHQYIAKTVAAHVIGTSGTDLSRVLVIDKGSRDGLKTDMPVITPDGVVGKVRDVFPHTAQVLEINDQTSGLGIVLTKTRLRGILRGNAAGQTEIIDILPDERIQPGEPVVTSGGDSVYPSGLSVGTVERVVNDPEHNPYVAVLVHPAVNLSRLDEVLVITQTQNTMPASMEQDLATSEQKAADILAQRLPSVPPPPTVGPDGKPINPNAPPPPVRPPASLHPDQFTPDATPPAASLTPGGTYPNQVYPAQPPPAAAAQATTPASPSSRPAETAPAHSQTKPATAQPKLTTPQSKPANEHPTATTHLDSATPASTTEHPKPVHHPAAATSTTTGEEPQN
ncbi:MAG TPA: rod shape-determining protein MreC [Acidobacteriaceae bacterium]|nr:rod shape-determining protein MreC [Acidobacteriaceae bacterium]